VIDDVIFLTFPFKMASPDEIMAHFVNDTSKYTTEQKLAFKEFVDAGQKEKDTGIPYRNNEQPGSEDANTGGSGFSGKGVGEEGTRVGVRDRGNVDDSPTMSYFPLYILGGAAGLGLLIYVIKK
jgi:hypothetical protein